MCALFDNEVIGKIELGPTADLVFSVSAFRGRYYANIRRFQHTEHYKGPTKAGLALRPDLLAWLIKELGGFRQKVPDLKEAEIGRTRKRNDADIVIQTVLPEHGDDVCQLDIREYVQGKSYSGPTKKGVRFGVDDLAQALTFLKAQAVKISELEGLEPGLFEKTMEPQEEYQGEGSGADGVDQVVSEILSEGPKRFPEDFLSETKGKFLSIPVPPEPIRLGQLSSGKQQVVSEAGFLYEAKNPVEGKYIVYAHMAGSRAVRMPDNPFDVFRAVKQYEIYVRGIQKALAEAYCKRTNHRPTAQHLARSAFQKLGLPWLEG